MVGVQDKMYNTISLICVLQTPTVYVRPVTGTTIIHMCDRTVVVDMALTIGDNRFGQDCLNNNVVNRRHSHITSCEHCVVCELEC